jgi:hypothetical protein
MTQSTARTDIPHPEALRAMSERGRARREQEEKLRRETEALREQQALDYAVETYLPAISQEILLAAQEGATSKRLWYGKTHLRADALRVITGKLTEAGYDVHVDQDEEDMGDSAAPCRIERWVITVRWAEELEKR